MLHVSSSKMLSVMAFVAVLLNFAEAHLPTKVDSCLRCSGSCLGLQICRIAHAGRLTTGAAAILTSSSQQLAVPCMS